MKLFLFPWTRVPDEEYVARIRKNAAQLDRWRIWLILMFGGMLAVMILIIVTGVQEFLGMMQPATVPMELIGLIFGAMFGFVSGWIFFSTLNKFILIMFRPRSERLLLKYYDAFNLVDSDDD